MEGIGKPSEEFYKTILPPNKQYLWEELRQHVRNEYQEAIQKFGQVFPKTQETLDVLKRRGYKLALYSNCSKVYFDTVISTFGLRSLFDYAECIGENGLSKSKLIQKIKHQFSTSEAAVIGDRIHDIEAARENNLLSIGARYGYGDKEPEQADLQINNISALLGIFDRKISRFERF